MEKDNYKKILNKAILAGKDRDYKKAVKLLKVIISETESFPEALLYLGRSYHALEDFEKAIITLKYFINVRPEVSAGYFFIGRSYLAYGLFKHAVYYFKIGLKADPKNTQLPGLLGMAYLKLKKPQIAVRYMEKAVNLDPDNKKIYIGYLNTLLVNAIRIFHIGDFETAKQMLEFIQQNGNKGIVTYVYLAIIEKEFQNYEKALEYLNAAVQISPDDLILNFYRVELLLKTGKKDTALAEMKKIEKILPDSEKFSWENDNIDNFMAVEMFKRSNFRKAIFYGKNIIRRHYDKKKNSDSQSLINDIHLLIGESYRNLGDFEKSNNHFLRVLDNDKRNLESRYGISMILWKLEKYEDLLLELKNIDAIDPGNKISSYYSALCYSKLNYPIEETIPKLQNEIRSSGPDPFLMTSLGEEYIKSDLVDLSEKWFKKSLVLSEEHLPAFFGLVEVYKKIKNDTNLLNVYKDILLIQPDNIEIRSDYIYYLVCNLKHKTAIVEIQKVLPHKKNDVKLHRLLAICLRKTKKYQEALIIYRQLLKGDPRNELFLSSHVFCLEKLKKRKIAIEFLEKAISYIGKKSNLLLILGVFYYKEKNIEKALKIFREVIKLNPEDWRAYENMGRIYSEMGISSFSKKFLSKADKIKKNT